MSTIPRQTSQSARGPRLQVLALLVILLACFGVAGLGGYWTALSVDTWYAGLAKPPWTPPDWVFGPVWTALYLGMAVAAFLVWRERSPHTRTAQILFGVQLLLNLAWSGLFFGLRNPGAALVDILLLWVAIFATWRAFRRISPAAGWLMAPYLLWVSYAVTLNFAIWRMNP
jgi:tryptophan-rich sensory protein